MGVATVIVSFVVCLALNVFLNSFDVYSDLGLTYKTLTFNLGDNLLLTGCRVCHDKENEEIYKPQNKSCRQCLTRNWNFHCGGSYQMLNKLKELEKKDTCNEERFSLKFNSTSNTYYFRSGECNWVKDECCIENSNQTLFSNS